MQDQSAVAPADREAENRAKPTTADVVRQYEKYVFPQVKNLHTEPMVVTDGRGGRVKDLEERTYLDFFGGILTVSLATGGESGHHRSGAAAPPHFHSLPYLADGRTGGAPGPHHSRRAAEVLLHGFRQRGGRGGDHDGAELHRQHRDVIALRHGYSGAPNSPRG